MSLMSKLLMSTTLISVVLSANAQPDNKQLVKYVKKNVVKNPDVKVKGVTVLESKKETNLPGWDILLTTMDLDYQGKEIHAPEMMFVKDGLVTGHLVDLKTGNDYRESIKPTVPTSMYNDAHLLYGNKDAMHKIIVFSDPQCPFCQEIVPNIFKAARENPKKIALYYYHLPLLRIHPVSGTLTRVMHIAQEEGKKDVVEKMYTLKIQPQETNMTKILSAVQAHTGYSVAASKVKSEEADKAIKEDEEAAARMMVTGTPTIYIDGNWDKMRDGYKKLIK
ncbi:MAG: hypothetical protein DSZ08_08115 [Sulfurovum sp.]|nr:MAG: hypothetical protein DSZ08_08115 [Sulfurovum sp.]